MNCLVQNFPEAQIQDISRKLDYTIFLYPADLTYQNDGFDLQSYMCNEIYHSCSL